MSNTILGIDVSKATLDVALLNGKKHEKRFSNDEKGFQLLDQWLQEKGAGNPHVCMEATGRYAFPVAKVLFEQGYPVSVVNPARIKAYRQSCMCRNKTDKQDALLIAKFCETQKPDPWMPLAPHFELLQTRVRHMNALKDSRQQERNRKKSGIEDEFVLEMIHNHIQYIEDQITCLEQEIKSLVEAHEDLKWNYELLISIPGIAFLTAVRIMAEVQDVSRFESAAQLAAYAGLTPRQFSSGTSVHGKARISKTGNVHLRRAMYMPVLSAKRSNPIIKTFCERLEEKNKPGKVIVCAAMRKLLHIAFGVLKHGKPFDPNYLNK